MVMIFTEDNGFFLTTVAVDRIDDLLHFFLPQQTVYQIKTALWRQLGQQRTKDEYGCAAGLSVSKRFLSSLRCLRASLVLGPAL